MYFFNISEHVVKNCLSPWESWTLTVTPEAKKRTLTYKKNTFVREIQDKLLNKEKHKK